MEEKIQVNKGKKWQSGQEYEPDEEDLEKFKTLYDEDAITWTSMRSASWKAKGLEKPLPITLEKVREMALGKAREKVQRTKGWPSRTRSLMMKQMSLKRRLTKMP